jgi:hypothetical protein
MKSRSVALPILIDIHDDLYRALEATDEDDALAEEIETVLDRLDAFEDCDLLQREANEVESVHNPSSTSPAAVKRNSRWT